MEDPIWKRVAAAVDFLPVLQASEVQGEVGDQQGGGAAAAELNSHRHNKTRQFLMRVANRVFTDRSISQVEVIAYLVGYPMDFSHNPRWTFLNANRLFWSVLRLWPHLREASGINIADDGVGERILIEEHGRQRITLLDAYPHRGLALERLCLYDYMALVQLKPKTAQALRRDPEIPLDSDWLPSIKWTQSLRRANEDAVVCINGYLSMDFTADEDSEGPSYRRLDKAVDSGNSTSSC